MRAVVEGIEVEGTPQEIAEFLASIRISTRPIEERVSSHPDDYSGISASAGMTPDFAYRTLRRLPLSQMQKSLLLKLRRAHPGWVGASEILHEMSWTGMQLGGVLGGLGRRLTATKGYESGFELWTLKWSDDEGEYAYRLSDEVVSALNRMEL